MDRLSGDRRKLQRNSYPTEAEVEQWQVELNCRQTADNAAAKAENEAWRAYEQLRIQRGYAREAFEKATDAEEAARPASQAPRITVEINEGTGSGITFASAS